VLASWVEGDLFYLNVLVPIRVSIGGKISQIVIRQEAKMRRRAIWIALIVLLVGLVGFGAWVLTPAAPMPIALAAIESDQAVMVSRGEWLVFYPSGQTTQTGLILYPGGLVDPLAYAPAAKAISAEGYMVVIVPMPLNLAVLAASKAGEVIAAYPEIKLWAIGGHSLGGAMAARFAYQNPELVEGLVLWAAYPARGDDLSDREIPVVSIYASNDGLTSLDDIEASRALLPPKSDFTIIEGGNHAQFGWYEKQSGDKPAMTSREAQQEQIIAATLSMLGSMEGE
jgi:hypothetical protein